MGDEGARGNQVGLYVFSIDHGRPKTSNPAADSFAGVCIQSASFVYRQWMHALKLDTYFDRGAWCYRMRLVWEGGHSYGFYYNSVHMVAYGTVRF